MVNKLCLFISIALLFTSCANKNNEDIIDVDVCVYGGSSAGIIAAYTAKKMGKSVIVIEPGKYIGGLTTGGLGATDIGNKYAITGLAKDFYRRVGGYYDKFEQWTFEPHVASKVYDDLVQEAQLDIHTRMQLVDVKKEDGWIKEISIEGAEGNTKVGNKRVRAKMFLDCTYEGDLMAKAGVSYTFGRESSEQYGESYNGVQMLDIHQFPDGIDPYVKAGDPSSGLLWGISEDKLEKQGTGDKKIQAYNFRLALTQDKNKQIAFARPENYNADHYELLLRLIEKEQWKTINGVLEWDTLANGDRVPRQSGVFLIKEMPNGLTDFNNFGAFSTDMIGANHDYPEANYAKRKEIFKAHEDYTRGLLYFLANDNRVPQQLRNEMNTWGYSSDEFKDQGGFSNQLYVREARRMVGRMVMTQNHSEGKEVVDDQVAMAAYGMDSHNIQRIVVNGMVKNEGDVQIPVGGPYPISYRAITPKEEECKNLLVPVCVSASHIAFGSIRMEPVFMVLGQSAATAAVLAIDSDISVQDVEIDKLQKLLTEDPYVDGRSPDIIVDNDDKESVRIVGDWGVFRGGYGVNQMLATPAEQSKSVQFVPNIPKNGEYEVFVFVAKNPKRSKKTEFEIYDGHENKKIVLETDNIKELGLSSSEWVSMGRYTLEKGKKSYVEISNKNADGVVIADAIIWKPVNN